MNETVRRVSHVENIRYDKEQEQLYIIDQTLLPGEEREIRLTCLEDMVEAIRMLRVRGAPAIGICAGYCMYVLARSIPEEAPEAFFAQLQSVGETLAAARPTAVNLGWAVRELLQTAQAHLDRDRPALLEALYEKAVEISHR